MIHNVLKSLGLDDKEITIYLNLLHTGATKASILAYRTKLPRTSVQNILIRLEKEGFVNKIMEENTYIYSAINPENLVNLVHAKEIEELAKYKKLKKDITEILPELKGIIGGNRNFPKIQFFKGKEAIRKVLFDTLTSKTELKGFTNVEAMLTHGKNINSAYVAEREKTNIKKRGILLDTPFARENHKLGTYSPKSYVAQKWIDSNLYPFALEMNIYDGKISYITYVEEDFVGVIIENQYIYEMHSSMWNLIWDLLP